MSLAAFRLALPLAVLAACAAPASHEQTEPLAQAQAAEDAVANPRADAGARTQCTPPPSCGRVVTIGFQFDGCCTDTLPCGIDMTPMLESADLLDPEIRRQVLPPEFGPGNTCLHPSRFYVPVEGPEEERVAVRGAPDILLTPACSTYNMFNFPMPGCCLPSGTCGMSSHMSISNVIPFVAPGSSMATPQCLSPAELHRQLQGTPIERLAEPPEITARCDYVALDARLPKISEPPAEEEDLAPTARP